MQSLNLEEQGDSFTSKADKLMQVMVFGLVLYSLALAAWYNTWVEAVVIAGGTLIASFLISTMAPNSNLSRITYGISLMAITALNIHQSHGMIEFHFGIFALLAVLLVYRDLTVILAATLVVAVHHIAFFYAQTQGLPIYVLDSADRGWWVIFLHAGYLIVESIVLMLIAASMKREAQQAEDLAACTSNIVRGDQIHLGSRTSGATPLLKKFDLYTKTIESLVTEVKSLTGQLAHSSDRVNSMTEAVGHSVGQQKLETEKIASAIEEMSASSREMSNNAGVAASSALVANEDARNCRSASLRTDSSIKDMAKKIQEAVVTVTSLNDQSSQIGSVVNVIRGVADQTNLLALNAAIEAARAGEQGRGFAVVADEVRTLAQRSQESTGDIDRMIEALQSKSEAAVAVIEGSQSLVEACVANTQESLQLIEKVSSAITQINQLNQAIANATQEQANVAAEISENIVNIASSGETVLAHTHNATEEGHSLRRSAKQLESLTRRFTL